MSRKPKAASQWDSSVRPSRESKSTNAAVRKEEMLKEHSALMSSILEDEEVVINEHRRHIEDSMELVRKEMQLLADVDQPGSAIDEYVGSLEALLDKKTASIKAMQKKLASFQASLRREEELSNRIAAAANK